MPLRRLPDLLATMEYAFTLRRRFAIALATSSATTFHAHIRRRRPPRRRACRWIRVLIQPPPDLPILR